MRQVRVPVPTQAWEISCEGPLSPTPPNAKDARWRLDRTLARLPRLDHELGCDGWTVVWQSAVLGAGALLKVWLWCARSGGADALQRALGGILEADGFTVGLGRVSGGVDATLQPRPVYVRAGIVGPGLEPRTLALFATLIVESEERADVDLGLSFRFGVQRCPACGVEDHPAALVGGFPDQDLLVAAELGEIAFVDGGAVDRRSRRNARCRRCQADFVAR